MAKRLKNELVTGNRSQAESILIDLLRFHFKKLKVLPNDKSAIGKELDIFLPDFKYACEVQGPTHQRVIFSEETFIRTVENDKKKAWLCEQAGIRLYAIYLPENSANYYVFLKAEIKEKIIPDILEWRKRNNF